MSKKQLILMLVLTFIGGIIGGIISGKIFANNEVCAKTTIKPKIIEAKEFRVIDDDGNHLGSFGAENLGAVLSINHKDGKDSFAVKLHYMGLETQWNIPGYWKYERVETKILPFGFTYREYSKLDLEAIKENPLSFLSMEPSPDHIKIGEGDNRHGPAIQLYDNNNKLRAVLGATNLWIKKSGSTIQRPASSLVLFNEYGNVIWKAP